MKHTVEEVQQYWNSHLNLTQFISLEKADIGSDRFFQLLETSLGRFGYKEALLRNFAKGFSGKKLLEVGCGLGLELARLGKLGFDVTGIDLAPTAVKLCNEHLQRKNLRGKALVENAEQMNFQSETFDAVYSSGVLQHTPHVNKAIDEIWRVLKPGGKALIILYHRYSWFYLLYRLSGINIEFESSDAPIINTYTKKELRSLFRKFDDVNIECEYYYPMPTRRKGMLAVLFNRGFVPLASLLPRGVMQKFGWHLILTFKKAHLTDLG